MRKVLVKLTSRDKGRSLYEANPPLGMGGLTFMRWCPSHYFLLMLVLGLLENNASHLVKISLCMPESCKLEMDIFPYKRD